MAGSPNPDWVAAVVHPGLVQQLWVLVAVSPVEGLPPVTLEREL